VVKLVTSCAMRVSAGAV